MLNENIIKDRYTDTFSSIFDKIDRYSSVGLYESKAGDIYFNQAERKATLMIVRMIQEHILQTYYGNLAMNEGIGDNLKKGIKGAVDKVKQLPDKLRKAYIFCQGILKKGFTKVSEFVQFIVELFSKIADSLKETIIALGGFEISQTVKEEKSHGTDVISLFTKSEGEKRFMNCVMEYVAQRQGNKEYLNEDVLDDIESTVAGNKFLSSIICDNYKGTKLSFWQSLLISIVGCLVINIGIGVICTAIGAASVAGVVTTVAMFMWSCKGILKTILIRKREMKANNENKFWNKAVVISILISVGVLTLFSIPCVKDFIGNLVSDGMDWSSEKIQQFMEMCKDKNTEEISGALSKVATTSTTVYAKMITTKCVTATKDAIAKSAKNVIKNGIVPIATLLNSGIELPKNAKCLVFRTNNGLKKFNTVEIKKAIQKLGGHIINFSDTDKGLAGVVIPKDKDVSQLETMLRKTSNDSSFESGVINENLNIADNQAILNKKALYESIMYSIAKIVRSALNDETFNV